MKKNIYGAFVRHLQGIEFTQKMQKFGKKILKAIFHRKKIIFRTLSVGNKD